MKRTNVPWSKLLESARAKKARERQQEFLREGEFETLVPRESLRKASDDALREAYESLDGGFVLDLDGV